MEKIKNFFSIFSNRRINIALLLGFSSGLPLLLSSSTLQAWYAKSDISLKDIGFLSLAGIPYTFKYLWAPFMDKWIPPLFGRRRGWIIIAQFCLCIAIASMALFSPSTHPKVLLFIAFMVAFFSASQDIAINAYTTDMLHPDERPLGAAMNINGYRVAMLIAGGGSLVIAGYWGFETAYLVMVGLMSIGILATFFGPNPELNVAPPKGLWDCTVLPFIDFFKRPQSVWILLFIFFYKLGDAFGGTLVQTFLLREIKFSLVELGTIIKFVGFTGTIMGTVVGALLIPRFGWVKSLFVFGVLQTITNLVYLVLMWTGPNYMVVGLGIFIENLCGGMATAAFYGFMMGLCNPRFTALQFALLSSLSSFGRVFTGPPAGMIADYYGWTTYFLSSVALSVPGLILVLLLKKGIETMTANQIKERENQMAAAPAN